MYFFFINSDPSQAQEYKYTIFKRTPDTQSFQARTPEPAL